MVILILFFQAVLIRILDKRYKIPLFRLYLCWKIWTHFLGICVAIDCFLFFKAFFGRINWKLTWEWKKFFFRYWIGCSLCFAIYWISSFFLSVRASFFSFLFFMYFIIFVHLFFFLYNFFFGSWRLKNDNKIGLFITHKSNFDCLFGQ